ncbi:methylated-DNA--[protein]-cysteine S-methyltransferase [Alphaproteobacteria bacterium LSUCC0719]
MRTQSRRTQSRHDKSRHDQPGPATAKRRRQAQRDYRRIEAAIAHIAAHYLHAPSLDELAAAVHLSPFHFQRLFTRWAGVSPKRFARYLSLDHARALLRRDGVSCLDAAYESGLSGPGRLHDMFVRIEAMTPGEYGRGGAGLQIGYGFAESLFGEVLVAATPRGICHLAFADDREAALDRMRATFPAADFVPTGPVPQAEAVQAALRMDWSSVADIRLHLRATSFQMKVWEALLQIPTGRLASYGDVAAAIGRPGAGRAVGTAIGANPVALLIPCHRVIRQSGEAGGYMWGASRKQAIIGWESARHDSCDVEDEGQGAGGPRAVCPPHGMAGNRS